jgi:aquaporin Z
MNIKRKCAAEALGTAWLVIGGCGTAMIGDPSAGRLGVAFAFGLSLLGGIYALGHISGGHFNPAVTLGLSAAGRFPRRNSAFYVAAQTVGAILGAGFLALLASSKPGLEHALESVANGYGDHSPAGFGLIAGFLTETLLSLFFVLIVLGATDGRAPLGFAPLAISLSLVAIHLVGIPITNLSVNPARSTGIAAWTQGWALAELWLFWLSPVLGGTLGGLLYRIVSKPT